MAVSNAKMKHFVRNNNNAIEITVTTDQYDRAEKRGDELGVLRNSITKGKSNGWGMLGEEIIGIGPDQRIEIGVYKHL